MISNSIQITPDTEIRRIRIMPARGNILVRKGERVNPDDVIAETKVNSKYYGLDVARGLGVSAEEVLKYINIPEGKEFRKGKILAGPRGISKRVVRAPSDGTLLKVYRGVAILKDSGQLFYLKSGLTGKVTEIIPHRGVVIETKGALIQAVWGNGNLGAGQLVEFNDTQSVRFLKVSRPNEIEDMVIFTRVSLDQFTLRRIKNFHLKGLILPSVNPSLIQDLLGFPYAVVVLDSFSNRQMNIKAQKILSKSVGHRIEISAVPWEQEYGNRPEIIIPKIQNNVDSESTESKINDEGHQVKIVSSPYAGEMGRFLCINRVSRLSNGLLAKSAEVLLANGNQVTVPINNIEFVTMR